MTRDMPWDRSVEAGVEAELQALAAWLGLAGVSYS
jgi:hypothetical protein